MTDLEYWVTADGEVVQRCVTPQAAHIAADDLVQRDPDLNVAVLYVPVEAALLSPADWAARPFAVAPEQTAQVLPFPRDAA